MKRDYQGNNRVVVDQEGVTEQINHYYPYGGTFGEGLATSTQSYKFGGKELDRMNGLDWSDFGARMLDHASATWGSICPMAEKYYASSPYNYCAANPISYVDPDGKDIWEINEQGKVIRRIPDKTQDTFYFVKQNENGAYARDYTIDDRGNKTYKSITFKYKTITSMRKENIKTKLGSTIITMFNVTGDKNATNLFEFLANPNVTTNVEWSHDKVGTEKSQKNIVGTSNLEDGTYQADYLRSEGYIIQENIHSHPGGTGPSTGDRDVAKLIYKTNIKAYFMIYIGNGEYKYYVPSN